MKEPIVVVCSTHFHEPEKYVLLVSIRVQVLVSMPIQCFFAWRISKITKSYIIPGFIVVLALTSASKVNSFNPNTWLIQAIIQLGAS